MATETNEGKMQDNAEFMSELTALREENMMLKEHLYNLMTGDSVGSSLDETDDICQEEEPRLNGIEVSKDSYITSNQALVNSVQYLLSNIDYGALVLLSENLIKEYVSELNKVTTEDQRKALELKIQMEKTYAWSLTLYKSFSQKANEILLQYNFFASSLLEIETRLQSGIITADMSMVSQYAG